MFLEFGDEDDEDQINGSSGPAAFETHGTGMNGHANGSSNKKKRTEHDDFDNIPGLFVSNENDEPNKGGLDDNWPNTGINSEF
jgi:hypothetical protein